MVELANRYLGTLVGLAIGDALGGPLEFMSLNQIRIKHGWVDTMIGGGWLDLRPGETTDDTAMALALADGLIACRGFDREDVARRYVAWANSGPKDIGNVTRASLALIEGGMSVDDACPAAHEECDRRSAGNGSLMRCAPLALCYRSHRRRLIEVSLADARITHWDRKAGSGSAALNLMISIMLEGETDRAAIRHRAQSILTEDDQGAEAVLPDPHVITRETARPTGYVLDSLECALWAFETTRTFKACLEQAVNLGGDADTIGAVAGALAGAYYGIEKIPADWRSALEEGPQIERRAHKLLGLAV